MKAIVQAGYGNVDVLQLREVPVPTPGAGEVLVRIRAAGVDRGTWHLMTGLPLIGRLAFGMREPKQPVLGMDLAGLVEAVGEGVTGFAVGDAVFGTTGRGSFAEFAVVPVGALARKPEAFSFEEAAAVPISAVTALQALRDHGRLRSGQKVLIIGASGGVGSFAVQLAKALGAEVTGVCSTSKVELVRELGAVRVIDYTREGLGEGADRYDLVLDIGGSRPVSQLRRVLTPTGTLVIVGGEGGGRWFGGLERQLGASALSPFIGQRLVFFISRSNAADLETLSALAQRGDFRPVIDRTFPLAEASGAVDHMSGGHARGKVVVTV